MEVIVDTNVIMDAIFDQFENEDCWQILHFIRNKQITPVVCFELLREYTYVPSQIVILSMKESIERGTFSVKDIPNSLDDLYNCYSDITNMFLFNSKVVRSIAKNKYCDEDPDDDKIINLAVGSNCTLIITKNTRHFECIDEKHIRTYNNKEIEVYNPEQFISNFKLIEKFHAKLNAQRS